jgi:hypothetical protein
MGSLCDHSISSSYILVLVLYLVVISGLFFHINIKLIEMGLIPVVGAKQCADPIVQTAFVWIPFQLTVALATAVYLQAIREKN